MMRSTLADTGESTVSLGKISTNSKLENLVRQNDQIWQSLHDLKGTYPAVRGASKADPPKVSYYLSD